MSLSPNALKIQTVLESHGKHFKVIELSASAHTAQEAATALGCEVAQIVKSLVFVMRDLKKPILVLVSGSNRVNEKALEKALGSKISKADAVFVKEATGFSIGGVPPVGHVQAIETYIDEDLLRWDELWAAAGTPHAIFKLNSAELPKLTSGRIISIK